MIARNLSAQVFINSVDVTRDLSPYLRSIEYQDVESSETDVLTLELEDRERLFIGDWLPTRGDTLEVELIWNNKNGDGLQERLPLGVFEVDEVELSYPASVCKMKANSVPQNSLLREVDESKSWEEVPLSSIAADIAAASGVELVYDVEFDPKIARAEQGEQSRLAFLEKLCRDNAIALKVADGKLILFDEVKLEEQEPVLTLTRDVSAIEHFRANATLTEIYKECRVSYKHGKHSELYEATFPAPDKKDGKILKINQRVESTAEAERLARKSLREKNKDEIKISLTTVGDFNLLSGNVLNLRGFGWFDGKYLIERARHSIGGGYTTAIECHKCLSY